MALPNLGFLFRSRDGDDSRDRRNTERQSDSGSERSFVLSMRLGDVAAFETLFHVYYVPLVRFLTRYTGLRETAEDIAQDTFAQVWRSRAELDPNRSFRGYVFKIARNRASDVMHHDQVVNRHVTRALEDLGDTVEQSPHPGPDVEAEMADIGRLADQRVALLSPRLREVYRLSREEFLTPGEIAMVLGTSVHTVHKQLAKVIDLLAPVLKRWLDE